MTTKEIEKVLLEALDMKLPVNVTLGGAISDSGGTMIEPNMVSRVMFYPERKIEQAYLGLIVLPSGEARKRWHISASDLLAAHLDQN